MFMFFHVMEWNMSMKLHFHDSHMDSFPQTLGEFSDEDGERFHKDIFIMEKQFVRRWNCNMLAECCCL
jgi:hypothetical protein